MPKAKVAIRNPMGEEILNPDAYSGRAILTDVFLISPAIHCGDSIPKGS